MKAVFPRNKLTVLGHGDNEMPCDRASEVGGPALTDFFAHQILSQGRLGRDYHDLLPLIFDFQSAAFWADKITSPPSVRFQFDQRGHVDRVIGSEFLESERIVKGDGVEDFLRLA